METGSRRHGEREHSGGAPLWRIEERRGAVAAAATLFLAGAFFVWEASALDFGSLSLPGAGFFPLVLGAGLAALAAIIGTNVARAPGEASTDQVELGHRDVLVAFGALLAVPLAFERAGAYLTLGVFSFLLLVVIGKASALRAALACAAGMAGVWYFFKVLLGLQLPNGPL
jgi:putative tricarboxylic transport membrane protein